MRLVLEQVAPVAGDWLLDPSCGDGEFLVGAARFLVDTGAVHRASELAACLIGFDVNPAAVSEAQVRLAAVIQERLGETVDPHSLRIYCENALDLPDRAALDGRLGSVPARLLIVGNPPYVEAKRLSADLKAHLKRRFPLAASGAPDLYLYFLHACLDWLHPDDRLALVLPNKVLVNGNGRGLRDRMLDRGQLRAIDFATRTQIFAGAAVYPVVLYAAGAGGEGSPVRLASIQRQDDRLVRTPLPDIAASRYRATASRAFFPTPESSLVADMLESLVGALETGRLADVLDIRWTVSFHRQGLRERYVKRSREGMVHAQEFLGGGTFAGNGDVDRYRAQWSGWWIDYNVEALRSERNLLPPLELFQRPKIAICQNGRTLRAAFDDRDFVLKDTLLCGLLRDVDHPLVRRPRALVGLLSSQVVHFYYSHVFHGGHVNGGYLHFLRSFLDDIPLGQWTDASADAVGRLVRQREECGPGAAGREIEEQIEAWVAGVFCLNEAQFDALRAWAAVDENWCARDRIRRRAERQANGCEFA